MIHCNNTLGFIHNGIHDIVKIIEAITSRHIDNESGCSMTSPFIHLCWIGDNINMRESVQKETLGVRVISTE